MDKIEAVCKKCHDQQSNGNEISKELSELLPPGFKLVYEEKQAASVPKEPETRLEVVQEGDPAIPITGEPNVDIEMCLASTIYQDWQQRLSRKFLVRGIHFQSLDKFGPRVGFIKMKADIVTREGNKFVPGICLLRGGAVAILILITCEGDDYVVLTSQPRAPVSSSGLIELPAGMLDGSGNFAGVAAKEIKEETGLDIKSEHLVNLSDMAWGKEEGKDQLIDSENESPFSARSHPRGMYPSAGGCDEFLTLFLHRTTVTREQLDDLEGKLTGNIEEGEMITLKIIQYKELWRVADSKALSAMAIYEGLKTLSSFNELLPSPMPYIPADTADAD